MSPLKMGSRQVKGITAEELASRSQSLVAALGTGGDQLDPVQTRAGADVVDKVRARTALRGGHTVVALAVSDEPAQHSYHQHPGSPPDPPSALEVGH